MHRTRRGKHHQDDDYDSLAYDPEPPEMYIPSCPWMYPAKHDIGLDTIYSQPLVARDLDYVEHDADQPYFRYDPVPAGDDFKKKNCFVYIPNRLYNQQII